MTDRLLNLIYIKLVSIDERLLVLVLIVIMLGFTLCLGQIFQTIILLRKK